MDLTVAMDVEINPGPNTATLQCQGLDSQNQATVPQLSGTVTQRQQALHDNAKQIDKSIPIAHFSEN